ncbi:MAG: hypothetical protein ACE5IZ_10855, partial [Dehalococcoidia bacterium]
MAKGRRKPAVPAERRREWLQRHERGETPPQIASKDGFDVRTVRSAIGKAREEREASEAKVLTLRQALEWHFKDLEAFARELDSHVASSSAIPLAARGDRLWGALREHVPKSPLWTGIDRQERLLQDLAEVKQ